MKVWQVYYGNYDPPEVDSTHMTRATAEARLAQLHASDSMWRMDETEAIGSDLDTFRAMLERAGIRFSDWTNEDSGEPGFLVEDETVVRFNRDGSLHFILRLG